MIFMYFDCDDALIVTIVLLKCDGTMWIDELKWMRRQMILEAEKINQLGKNCDS